MHTIEPHYNWRHLYTAEEDPRSPFYGRKYSEFEFTHAIYDHLIHPQWDAFGSPSLFLKILYTNYLQGYTIIELFGEWNDCLHNDIMFLKRNVAELLMAQGINKFILIGENVLNFHYSDDSYYEEWFDEVTDTDGWIAVLNFRDHVLQEFSEVDADSYFMLDGKLNEIAWRVLNPKGLYTRVSEAVDRRFLSA